MCSCWPRRRRGTSAGPAAPAKGRHRQPPRGGAYDSDLIYQAAGACQPERSPDVVISPRSSAVPSTADPGCQSPRNRHIQLMAEHGRMAWQHLTGYGRRNVVEATMARYKGPIGLKLQARHHQVTSVDATHRHIQAGKIALAVQVLNRVIREAKRSSFAVADQNAAELISPQSSPCTTARCRQCAPSARRSLSNTPLSPGTHDLYAALPGSSKEWPLHPG